MSQDFNFSFEQPVALNDHNICNLFERVLKGDRRDMLRVISNTQYLAQNPENREIIVNYLKKKFEENFSDELEVNSFYSVKEFFGRILYVCMKHGDEFNAFQIIRYTQDLTFKEEKNTKKFERKMSSFYYSHPVTRRLEFWIKALKILFKVIFFFY